MYIILVTNNLSPRLTGCLRESSDSFHQSSVDLCLISSLSWNAVFHCPLVRSGYGVIKHFQCSTQLSKKIQLLIKAKILTKKKWLAWGLSDVVFILLINVKMPTIVGILTFICRINFVLSWDEHGKGFISYLSYQLHCCTLPDKRCLSHGMLPLSGHDDVALFEWRR